MNTILFIASIVILGLVVLSKIPGLEHTVRPIIDLVFTAIKAIFENLFSWGIWLFKLLWSAHIETLENLFKAAEDIDPSIAIKQASPDGDK